MLLQLTTAISANCNISKLDGYFLLVHYHYEIWTVGFCSSNKTCSWVN